MPRNRKGQGVEKPDSPHAVAGEVAEALHEVRQEEKMKKQSAREEKISKRYLETHACPVCGGKDVQALESADPNGFGTLYQPCSCGGCGARWDEEYKLTAIYNVEKE